MTEMPDANTILRSMPSMDELLNAPRLAEFLAAMGRDYVKRTLAEVLDGLKSEMLRGAPAPIPAGTTGSEAKVALGAVIADRAAAVLGHKAQSSLRRVINATGVVVHTNLGRAPLAREAMAAVGEVAAAYSTLEYSPEKGGRGGRNEHVEWLVRHITGAEAALVVNNNAAAVLLALSATATGREVVVSTGELVEIGGSFRIPDILSFSGATMVAVGCTNSTRLADYERAVTDKTAVLLKVHPSNFRVEGFVTSTSREELAELAAARDLVFLEDLGSGLLHRPAVPFAHLEHSVRESLEAGVGAVTFSGDKLLGGPQIGVIAGSRLLVDRMRKHQLLRALRVDKMTLAAFEATLRMYLAGRQGEIPVVWMMEVDASALRKKAAGLCRALRRVASESAEASIEMIATEDAVGGGSFPTEKLAGFGVAISLRKEGALGAEGVAAAFRGWRVPVVANINGGRVILHVRTLLDGDEREVGAAFASILGNSGNP